MMGRLTRLGASDATPAGSGLVVRRQRAEDDERAMEIHSQIHHFLPPVSREDYREWVTARPKEALYLSWVVELDGKVVGAADLEQGWNVREPGVFNSMIECDPECRCRGVGTMLLERILEEGQQRGIRKLYGEVSEDEAEALRFVEKRGFRKTGRVERVSRLRVSDVPLDSLQQTEQNLAKEGICIKTLEKIGTEDEGFLRELYAMEEATAHDIPSSEPYEPSPFEVWRERQLNRRGRGPGQYWVALDERRPVGAARLALRGERAAFNSYTCVDREYRGRGIAKALKLKSVEWARQNDIDYVYTDNDAENAAMLAVNVGMGYEFLPQTIEVVRESM